MCFMSLNQVSVLLVQAGAKWNQHLYNTGEQKEVWNALKVSWQKAALTFDL